MSRVELPDGWMELREVAKVTERLRRPVQTAIGDMGIYLSDGGKVAVSGAAINQWKAVNEYAAVALIASWSFGDTVSIDALLDLPGDAYDAIIAAVEPLAMGLAPSFSVAEVGDPKAPTVA